MALYLPASAQLMRFYTVCTTRTDQAGAALTADLNSTVAVGMH